MKVWFFDCTDIQTGRDVESEEFKIGVRSLWCIVFHYFKYSSSMKSERFDV